MKKLAMLLFVLALCMSASDARAVAIDLGTAGSFGALAGSGVTNSVAGTIINGDVGSSPTTAITGLLAADVNGILWPAGGAVVVQAKLDLVDAYNAAVGAVDGNTSEPVDLSGKTLDPNVYAIGAANFSTGNLTLDGGGDPCAQWIFHTTVLTTAADFNVLLINGASANNVFWQVGTSATIGIGSNFAGSILAMDSITFNGGGIFNGRALARNAHVTISTAMTINVPNFVPGEANVPYVTGLTQADANTAIIGAGLIVGTITNDYNDTVAAGLVISQNPVGGTAAAGGTDVNMVVSLGLPLIPNVVGLTQADANTAIIAASFTVGTITTDYNDTVAAGLVISQNPAGGTAAISGTDVNMVVSLGPPLILVYKVTMAINPEIYYEDANGLEAEVWKENLSAYVVFSVDDAYSVDDVNDANGSTVILFGKNGRDKFQMTLGGNDPNSFVNIWVFGDVNSINPFDVTNMHNTHATSVGIGFGDSNATTGFDIETTLYGKNLTLDIGLGQAEKRSVAKSLKGQVRFDSEGLFIEGWGNAKATLDTRLTKNANKNSLTVAETVANIQTTVLHNYDTVTVLP